MKIKIMKEIVLDNTLTIVDREFRVFDPRYMFDIEQGEFTPITEINAAVIHRNYIDYLTQCWRRHYGVIVSPTILWNMVLGNLAFEVNKDPEKYRNYFTLSAKKQEVLIQQAGNQIDVSLLVSKLQSYIPGDIIDEFFPSFSTDTSKSEIADYTSFLDLVSPYYNYGMYVCGIPKIKILGTKEDWELFDLQCKVLATKIPEFGDYLDKVSDKIYSIINDSADFSSFFDLTRCGSGSQVTVGGWIRDFFIEQPRVLYPENFISCISKIDYHNYTDKKDYRLYAGLFTSSIEDDYLVPEFDNIYFEKLKP